MITIITPVANPTKKPKYGDILIYIYIHSYTETYNISTVQLNLNLAPAHVS